MSNIFTPKFIFITVAIFIAALTRLMPHPHNFTAIGAMALFGGAMLKDKKFALLIPLVAMWFTDLILNNLVAVNAQWYDGFVLFTDQFYWIYGAIVLTSVLGWFMIKKVNTKNVVGASFASALVFFVITNFGSYMMFPDTFGSLWGTYAAGIPFFGWTLAGNLVFSAVLFGGYALAQVKFPVLAKA